MLVKPQSTAVARIKVVGVGGGGGNAINTMVEDKGIIDVEYISVNTDQQALQSSLADIKLQIGEQITRGLGSGGNPIIGKKAAEESVDDIHENLAGSDMIFITAGMGGGTGTGASPVVAEIARNLGALTIAVVMKPFAFEGKRRMEAALKGIEELRDKVDTMIVVPNQRLLEIMEPNASFFEAMHKADEVLLQAVKSIANLSSQTGLINVDFADVRSVMDDAGTALMGVGKASGEDRALEAAKMAVDSPLLEVDIDGATGVLFNVTGSKDLKIHEIDQAASVIQQRISPDANFIFGARIDPEMPDGEMEVTVLATGFSDADSARILSADPSRARRPQMPSYVTQPVQQQVEAQPAAKGNLFNTQQNEAEEGMEELEDMPSFLRRRLTGNE